MTSHEHGLADRTVLKWRPTKSLLSRRISECLLAIIKWRQKMRIFFFFSFHVLTYLVHIVLHWFGIWFFTNTENIGVCFERYGQFLNTQHLLDVLSCSQIIRLDFQNSPNTFAASSKWKLLVSLKLITKNYLNRLYNAIHCERKMVKNWGSKWHRAYFFYRFSKLSSTGQHILYF